MLCFPEDIVIQEEVIISNDEIIDKTKEPDEESAKYTLNLSKSSSSSGQCLTNPIEDSVSFQLDSQSYAGIPLVNTVVALEEVVIIQNHEKSITMPDDKTKHEQIHEYSKEIALTGKAMVEHFEDSLITPDLSKSSNSSGECHTIPVEVSVNSQVDSQFYTGMPLENNVLTLGEIVNVQDHKISELISDKNENSITILDHETKTNHEQKLEDSKEISLTGEAKVKHFEDRLITPDLSKTSSSSGECVTNPVENSVNFQISSLPHAGHTNIQSEDSCKQNTNEPTVADKQSGELNMHHGCTVNSKTMEEHIIDPQNDISNRKGTVDDYEEKTKFSDKNLKDQKCSSNTVMVCKSSGDSEGNICKTHNKYVNEHTIGAKSLKHSNQDNHIGRCETPPMKIIPKQFSSDNCKEFEEDFSEYKNTSTYVDEGCKQYNCTDNTVILNKNTVQEPKKIDSPKSNYLYTDNSKNPEERSEQNKNENVTKRQSSQDQSISDSNNEEELKYVEQSPDKIINQTEETPLLVNFNNSSFKVNGKKDDLIQPKEIILKTTKEPAVQRFKKNPSPQKKSKLPKRIRKMLFSSQSTSKTHDQNNDSKARNELFLKSLNLFSIHEFNKALLDLKESTKKSPDDNGVQNKKKASITLKNKRAKTTRKISGNKKSSKRKRKSETAQGTNTEVSKDYNVYFQLGALSGVSKPQPIKCSADSVHTVSLPKKRPLEISPLKDTPKKPRKDNKLPFITSTPFSPFNSRAKSQPTTNGNLTSVSKLGSDSKPKKDFKVRSNKVLSHNESSMGLVKPKTPQNTEQRESYEAQTYRQNLPMAVTKACAAALPVKSHLIKKSTNDNIARKMNFEKLRVTEESVLTINTRSPKNIVDLRKLSPSTRVKFVNEPLEECSKSRSKSPHIRKSSFQRSFRNPVNDLLDIRDETDEDEFVSDGTCLNKLGYNKSYITLSSESVNEVGASNQLSVQTITADFSDTESRESNNFESNLSSPLPDLDSMKDEQKTLKECLSESDEDVSIKLPIANDFVETKWNLAYSEDSKSSLDSGNVGHQDVTEKVTVNQSASSSIQVEKQQKSVTHPYVTQRKKKILENIAAVRAKCANSPKSMAAAAKGCGQSEMAIITFPSTSTNQRNMYVPLLSSVSAVNSENLVTQVMKSPNIANQSITHESSGSTSYLHCDKTQIPRSTPKVKKVHTNSNSKQLPCEYCFKIFHSEITLQKHNMTWHSKGNLFF